MKYYEKDSYRYFIHVRAYAYFARVQKWPHDAVMSNLEWEVKSKISKIKQQNYLFVF